MNDLRQAIDGVVYPPQWHREKYERLGVLGKRTLADVLEESFAEFSSCVALHSPEGDMTYRELEESSARFALGLLELGLQPLDRVIFQVVNSRELIIALLACWRVGLIPVCTLAAHREREIKFLASHSRARAHLVGLDGDFDYLGLAEKVSQSAASMEYTVIVRGSGPEGMPTMQSLIEAHSLDVARERIARIERDPWQVVVFQLSGGTTSIPKIIPRFSCEYLYNMERSIVQNGFRENDIVLAPLQIIHNAAMVGFTFPLMLSGGASVVLSKMDPAVMLQALAEYRPTVAVLTAASVGRMKEQGLLEKLDLSHLRLVVSTHSAAHLEAALGVPAVHLYGMTEGVVAFGRADDPTEARHGTIGRPLSAHDELRIVEPGTENDLPDGKVGEMLCRGPYTIFGYYDAPERDAEVFTQDSFFRSGDLMAARNINGNIYYSFEGRLKDLVNRGGEKINCEEVEILCRLHPAVHDIAIVPMPDEDLGERACAFVIPRQHADQLSVENLRDHLVTQGLAKFKCPERVELIDQFPLTASGKLSKPTLKEWAASKLNAQHCE